MPEGVLLELYQVLAGDGMLLVAGPDEYGLCRVGLTEAGQARYLALCQAQPTALRVPPGGGVHGDCLRRQPAPGPRPEPSAPDGRRAVRVGRRAEQIVGRERDRIAARLRERYDQGATIRALVIETGRSFGWVRTLLVEAGAELRSRGGDRRARRGPEEPGR